MRWTARLVASTLSPGLATRSWAMSGVASSRCSRLSRTRRRCFARSVETSVSASGRPPTSRTPRLWPIAEATSAGSGTAASGTKTTPSANADSSLSAVSRARRVLPTPPGPVSVTRRTSGRQRRSVKVVVSRSRPTSAVSGVGSGVVPIPRRGTGVSEIGSYGVRSGGGPTMVALRQQSQWGLAAHDCRRDRYRQRLPIAYGAHRTSHRGVEPVIDTRQRRPENCMRGDHDNLALIRVILRWGIEIQRGHQADVADAPDRRAEQEPCDQIRSRQHRADGREEHATGGAVSDVGGEPGCLELRALTI